MTAATLGRPAPGGDFRGYQPASPVRCVTYTRISKDQAGDAHGVANQQAALDAHAGSRGWLIVRRLSDNDLSASNGKRRPGFEETMRMVDARQADVVLCWAVDRFVRRIRDLEAVIDRFTGAGAKLAAVSGDLDLSSDAGRTVARMLSVIAQGEVERKGERQRLAASEAASNGKRWTGCPRPFGWQDDHVTADPAEAGAIRWAADAILHGSTLSAVAREWTRRGLRPPQAPFGPLPRQPWRRVSVKTILTSPAVAGIATYRGDEITAAEPAGWEPIVPEEQFRAVRAILTDPARSVPRGVRRLLGGLALCRCGNHITGSRDHAGRLVYRCNPPTRHAPGPHVSTSAAAVDEFVAGAVIARIALDGAELIAAPKRADVRRLRDEAQSIRVNLDELAADRALGLVTRSQMIAASQRGGARLAEITTALANAGGESALAPLVGAGDVTAAWDALDLPRQRTVIDALATITLHPAGRGRRVFDPDLVAIAWK